MDLVVIFKNVSSFLLLRSICRRDDPNPEYGKNMAETVLEQKVYDSFPEHFHSLLSDWICLFCSDEMHPFAGVRNKIRAHTNNIYWCAVQVNKSLTQIEVKTSKYIWISPFSFFFSSIDVIILVLLLPVTRCMSGKCNSTLSADLTCHVRILLRLYQRHIDLSGAFESVYAAASSAVRRYFRKPYAILSGLFRMYIEVNCKLVIIQPK